MDGLSHGRGQIYVRDKVKAEECCFSVYTKKQLTERMKEIETSLFTNVVCPILERVFSSVPSLREIRKYEVSNTRFHSRLVDKILQQDSGSLVHASRVFMHATTGPYAQSHEIELARTMNQSVHVKGVRLARAALICLWYTRKQLGTAEKRLRVISTLLSDYRDETTWDRISLPLWAGGNFYTLQRRPGVDLARCAVEDGDRILHAAETAQRRISRSLGQYGRQLSFHDFARLPFSAFHHGGAEGKEIWRLGPYDDDGFFVWRYDGHRRQGRECYLVACEPKLVIGRVPPRTVEYKTNRVKRGLLHLSRQALADGV
jgi:hypothetical protein